MSDERRIERIRQHEAEPGNADVPGDVPLQLRLGQAQPAEGARNEVAGVVGHQHERRFAAGVVNRDRSRLVRRQ